MAMVYDDPTLPPRYIVEHYRKAYSNLYRRDPMVRYMGNHWYYVNGETVHRKTLLDEISRLRDLSQRQTLRLNGDKTLIQRIIAKLRNL
jgi:hypothetical protein